MRSSAGPGIVGKHGAALLGTAAVLRVDGGAFILNPTTGELDLTTGGGALAPPAVIQGTDPTTAPLTVIGAPGQHPTTFDVYASAADAAPGGAGSALSVYPQPVTGVAEVDITAGMVSIQLREPIGVNGNFVFIGSDQDVRIHSGRSPHGLVGNVELEADNGGVTITASAGNDVTLGAGNNIHLGAAVEVPVGRGLKIIGAQTAAAPALEVDLTNWPWFPDFGVWIHGDDQVSLLAIGDTLEVRNNSVRVQATMSLSDRTSNPLTPPGGFQTNPGGNFRTGMYIDGVLVPPDQGGGTTTGAALFFGHSDPDPLPGLDGDVFIRTDMGAGPGFFMWQRRAGAWVHVL